LRQQGKIDCYGSHYPADINNFGKQMSVLIIATGHNERNNPDDSGKKAEWGRSIRLVRKAHRKEARGGQGSKPIFIASPGGVAVS
jgi:hypothetical protein